MSRPGNVNPEPLWWLPARVPRRAAASEPPGHPALFTPRPRSPHHGVTCQFLPVNPALRPVPERPDFSFNQCERHFTFQLGPECSRIFAVLLMTFLCRVGLRPLTGAAATLTLSVWCQDRAWGLVPAECDPEQECLQQVPHPVAKARCQLNAPPPHPAQGASPPSPAAPCSLPPS